jgi:C-terminal processing protease CtpA/Prc
MNDKDLTPPIDPVFRFGEIHKLIIGSLCTGNEREVTISVPARKPSKRRPPLVEPQSVAYQILKPSVGLLKVPFFSGAFGVRFSKLLDDAIEALKAQGCDRLIVDLRGCLGGSLGFAHLISYFCPGRIPIGYDITRKRLQLGYDVQKLPRVPMPSSRFGLLQCLLRFSIRDKSLVLMTQGLGEQPFHGRIAVLVNEWTNSAGEMAAQFAKDTKLATVVGRKTMGNVLGSTLLDAGNSYRLYLPIFGWYSPDGTYLEGSGVEPAVPADIDPKELACGQDNQLRAAIEVVYQ